MKKILLIPFFISFQFLIYGQLSPNFEAPLTLLSCAGDYGETLIFGQSKLVEWSIGEIMIHSGYGAGYDITNGQNQGKLTIVSTNEKVFSRVTIYPNPAENQFSIENLPEGRKDVNLYDYTGRTVHALTSTESLINLSVEQLPSGMYYLSITGPSNEKMSAKIIVIH